MIAFMFCNILIEISLIVSNRLFFFRALLMVEWFILGRTCHTWDLSSTKCSTQDGSCRDQTQDLWILSWSHPPLDHRCYALSDVSNSLSVTHNLWSYLVVFGDNTSTQIILPIPLSCAYQSMWITPFALRARGSKLVQSLIWEIRDLICQICKLNIDKG